MSNIVMSGFRLFTAEILGEMLGLDRLVIEPEEFLREDQAPKYHEIPD